MAIIKEDNGLISGGGGIESIEYTSFTITAGSGLNVPTSKKAKAISFSWNNEYILYAADGVNSNKLYSNNSDNGQTVTFGDSAITSTTGISGSNHTCNACIFY